VAQWIEHQVPVLRSGGSSPSMLIILKNSRHVMLAVFVWEGDVAESRYIFRVLQKSLKPKLSDTKQGI
jgi:hypothetical protein